MIILYMEQKKRPQKVVFLFTLLTLLVRIPNNEETMNKIFRDYSPF